MQKRPTLWRGLLVASLAVWAFLMWYPPQGTDMVDAFAQGASGQKEQIIAKLRDAASKINKGDELSKDTWMDAVGEADLRELFPAKTNSLQTELNLDKSAWEAPDEEQKTKINRAILSRIQKASQGKVKLGLDLKGGTQFVVQVEPKTDDKGNLQPVNADQLTKAMEIMRRRVDRFGLAEPLIQTSGEDKIIIQVPALSQDDRKQARDIISEVAKLEFRLTHRDSDTLIRSSEEFVPGAELLSYDLDGTPSPHFVLKEVALSGSHIKSASARRNDLTGVPEIHFTLDALGANQFAKITEAHKVSGGDPRLLCIVLDGDLISAPSINSRIHARGQITGSFSEEEASMLANSLENPLENNVQIIEERDVAPSLGRDSVAKGYKAAIWGLAAVVVFMLIYYLLSGVVANIALALNIVMILGILCWFDATLTLPGIAGVVLTIGMAVDANVLIFERIREELNVGKSLKGAIDSGYDKAFGTIFDANVTTLIASTILIYMGKGPVQGFGVTLTIGIITSMFTALVATRVVLDMLINAGLIGSDASKRVMHLRPKTNLPTFDFLKYATHAFVISWLLIIAGFGYGLTKGKDSMLGVDFAGGYSMNMGSLVVEKLPDGQEKKVIGSIKPDQVSALEESISTGKIREKISLKAKVQANQIQAQLLADKSSDARVLQIDFPLGRGSKDAENVEEALIELFPEAGLQVLKLDKVGPSVSGEIQKSALIAVMLALFGILIYVAFRYEYSFAVGAVIAVLHDVAMTGGWFFLSDRELNAPIVAAALTIIGFSINDTIVIFDRIRENLRMGSRGSFADVMNKSLNQTLSRTVITSGTTLLSTATLYFFGGTVINDFAFTFLVGVIVGTYSSIYIACFIVLKWHKGKRPELAAPTVDEDPVAVMS
jgi:SecD/SecF fusion protein